MIEGAYWRYFRRGQKIVLRTLSGSEGRHPPESFLGRVQHVSRDLLELQVGREDRGTALALLVLHEELEVVSVFAGMGMKMRGKICTLEAPGQVQIQPTAGLELFPRREHLRVDVQISLALLRRWQVPEDLRHFWHRRWHEPSAAECSAVEEALALAVTPVNLGAGGLRVALASPVILHELVLLRCRLEAQPERIDVLARVVWINPESDAEAPMCGLRFVGIREEDRLRIDRFVGIRYWKDQREGE